MLHLSVGAVTSGDKPTHAPMNHSIILVTEGHDITTSWDELLMVHNKGLSSGVFSLLHHRWNAGL